MDRQTLTQLPVSHRADIVVCGAGVAGAFAAIAAAREGMVMHSGIEGDPACSYLSAELRDRLRIAGGCDESGRSFDPMLLKIVLEQMLADAGVRLLYYTFVPDAIVEEGRVTSAVIANKDGLSRIEGRMFIDCTGDGDLCVRAGAGFRKGNPKTGVNQPMSLRYVVDGVDTLALRTLFQEVKARTGVASSRSPYRWRATWLTDT